METWGYEYTVQATEQGIGTKQSLRSFGQAQDNPDFRFTVVLQAQMALCQLMSWTQSQTQSSRE